MLTDRFQTTLLSPNISVPCLFLFFLIPSPLNIIQLSSASSFFYNFPPSTMPLSTVVNSSHNMFNLVPLSLWILKCSVFLYFPYFMVRIKWLTIKLYYIPLTSFNFIYDVAIMMQHSFTEDLHWSCAQHNQTKSASFL